MASNEVALVNAAFEEWRGANETNLRRSEAFELFCAEKVLHSLELTSEEIEAGRIGGALDGGIDAVYTVLGEEVIEEDHEILDPGTKPVDILRDQILTLYVVQAKEESSFGETAIDKLASSLDRLLRLEPDVEALETLYAIELLDRFRIFRETWRKLVTRRVKLKAVITYATLGNETEVNERVRRKATELCGLIERHLVGGEVDFQFNGAKELWAAHETVPSYALRLRFEKHENDGDSHLALVKVSDYYKFISDESDGSLLRHIFDWNVRDYQKGVRVNREITRSLEDPDAPDFWWLNNGITILCSGQVTTAGNEFILDDVQIVNGLQTSHTIHNEMQRQVVVDASSNRKLLVRILSTDDPEVRDQIIRATNSQTQVSDASLRATDKIQRQIESYFLAHGWFYDRRKNFYKNTGRNAERIVSIAYLAQSVMAIGLSQPHNSRARPSTLIRKNDDYAKIFSENLELSTYLWLAQTQKSVDNFLKQLDGVSTSERSNLRFYVSMVAVGRAHGSLLYSPSMLQSFGRQNYTLTNDQMTDALKYVRGCTERVRESAGVSDDRVAKSGDLTTEVKKALILDSAQSEDPDVNDGVSQL
uniref:AIPR family protein n=1 Tax=Arthrobacter sp. TaxID=1667 RepID=UPI000EB72409|nr:AIPR family protein [Arthrobacter sp.]AXV46406.1 abortive infection phage resistance protein AbiU [Arthrobacter sp.]